MLCPKDRMFFRTYFVDMFLKSIFPTHLKRSPLLYIFLNFILLSQLKRDQLLYEKARKDRKKSGGIFEY